MNKRVLERIKKGIARFRPILESARARDVNESDTIHIIHDMLSAVFGWDKYADITTEFQIRGTFCDLAIKHDGQVKYLVEAKAINNVLKENHLRQAIHYATDNGIEWAILTNGIEWQVHHIIFEQPVKSEFVFDFNCLDKSIPDKELIIRIYTLSKEAVKKDVIEEFAARRSVLNKSTLAALLTSPTLLSCLKRELRRMKRDVKVNTDEIKDILETEVIKRELVEGDEAKNARRRVRRAAGHKIKGRESKKNIAAGTDQTSELTTIPTGKP